jgi:hypothetical protein
LKGRVGYVVEELRCTLDGLGQFPPPNLPGRDAFVVPDIDPLLMKSCYFWIYDILVVMCVAHEHIGLIPLVGGKRLFQRDLPRYVPRYVTRD